MLQGVAGAVLSFVHIAVLITAVYALVHAAMQRPDAYPAVDKLTKPVWLIILVAALLLAFVMGPGFGSATYSRPCSTQPDDCFCQRSQTI